MYLKVAVFVLSVCFEPTRVPSSTKDDMNFLQTGRRGQTDLGTIKSADDEKYV